MGRPELIVSAAIGPGYSKRHDGPNERRVIERMASAT